MRGKLQSFRLQANRYVEKLTLRAFERLEKLPTLTVLLVRAKGLLLPVLFIAGLLVADMLLQGLSGFFLVNSTKALAPRVAQDKPYLRARGFYEDIIKINAFCPGCVVPDMQIRSIERPKDCGKARPLASGGLKIIGTIVLSNPKFSVATLSLGSGETFAARPGDRVGNFGTVFEIRRTRVCVLNKDGLLTYVEMPIDDAMAIGNVVPGAFPTSNFEGINKKSDTEFVIKRPFLQEKLQDPNLLFQAKAVAYKENGIIKGFQIQDIKPGSVYEALGIQVNDIITGVNGDAMTSVAQAQALYSAAATAKEVSIDVIRGGTTVNLKYQVQQ